LAEFLGDFGDVLGVFRCVFADGGCILVDFRRVLTYFGCSSWRPRTLETPETGRWKSTSPGGRADAKKINYDLQ